MRVQKRRLTQMNKKLLKTLTGLAIVGTALGAAFAYDISRNCQNYTLGHY